ncbi:MAG: LuxR C-terminal-related transcriptional regulator [Lachnospiraceae bacterium]
MHNLLKERKEQLTIGLLIGLCFLWTGSGYLSWLYHLIEKAPNLNADFLSEVVGYLFQALGLAAFAIWTKQKQERAYTQNIFFILAIFDLFFICLATLVANPAMILLTGFIMNFFHGLIAGLYLTYLATLLPTMHQGLAFGCGYALGSLGSFLISKITKDNFLTSPYVLILYVILVGLTILLAKNISLSSFPKEEFSHSDEKTKKTMNSTLVLACIAGIINDINRKYGYVACLSALIFPFLLLFLTNQTESSLYIWIISYTFTGFYTVYRILVITDLMKNNHSLIYIAGFGLLFGRIGDALSTIVGLTFDFNQLYCLWIGAFLFILTVIVFFILAERIYYPVIVPERTNTAGIGEDMSDTQNSVKTSGKILLFAKKYGLSSRETDILALALTEMTNVNIASELYISENTIKFHIRNILKKTGCANRNELKKLYSSTRPYQELHSHALKLYFALTFADKLEHTSSIFAPSSTKSMLFTPVTI